MPKMSSKPGLRTGPEEKVQDGMLERRHAVKTLLGALLPSYAKQSFPWRG